MAIIPRNEAELNRLYEGVQELQAEAGRIAGVATEAAVGAATFEETAQAQIGRTEISPELARREREAVAGLMGVKPSLEKEFEGVAIDPTRLGNIVAGRMNSYLGQIQDIQDTRRSRKLRIDDLIKSGATKAQAKALTLQSTLEQKRDEARTASGEFEFFFQDFRQQQEIARRAGEKSSQERKEKELLEQFNLEVLAFADRVKQDPEYITNVPSDMRGRVESYLGNTYLQQEQNTLESIGTKLNVADRFGKQIKLSDNEIRVQLWDDQANEVSFEDVMAGIESSPIQNKDRAKLIASEFYGQITESTDILEAIDLRQTTFSGIPDLDDTGIPFLLDTDFNYPSLFKN